MSENNKFTEMLVQFTPIKLFSVEKFALNSVVLSITSDQSGIYIFKSL